MDESDYPEEAAMDLGAIFAALADPHRRKVVERLAALPPGEECACGSFDLPVSKATRTHHFRVLRQSGLIRQRVLGKLRLNRLRREELERRFPGLVDLLRADQAA